MITDLLSHADDLLGQWVQNYGPLVYLIMFLIVFLETNILFGGPLPGDTLAIACGALTATGHLDGWVICIVNLLATILGYFFNYWFGAMVGNYFTKRRAGKPSKFMQKPVVKKAEIFFREYAEIAILFARFIPFMRSFAPFVAGMARMSMRPYAIYSIAGGFLWTFTYFFLGYFVTNVSVLSGHFWLMPPCLLLLFVPAWLVNRYFKRRQAEKEKLKAAQSAS